MTHQIGFLKPAALQHLFDRKHYSELRRRFIRRAMQPLFHASDARLPPSTGLSSADIRHVLICRPNHRLGNLLLLTPLVIEIQRLFPRADIDIVLAGEHVAELFRAFPNVKHIYNLSRRMVRHPVALARTMLRIRRAHYDLAIDPCETSQSGHLLVAVAKPAYVIAPPRNRSTGGHDPAGMERAPTHMAQWPVYMLRAVTQQASSGPDREFPALDIRLSVDERQHARRVLDSMLHTEGKWATAIIGVFAEATGSKSYGSDWWRRFIEVMQSRHPDAAIVEIAPPDGRPRLAPGVPFFSSPSPREVAAVISNMTCFVSADCGVMHLASASGAPTIGLFSVTQASKYAPYGHGSQALDTRGKSPEETAQTASALIDMFAADHSPAPDHRPVAVPTNNVDAP